MKKQPRFALQTCTTSLEGRCPLCMPRASRGHAELTLVSGIIMTPPQGQKVGVR